MLIAVLRTLRSTYHLYLLSSFFFTPPATTEIYTLSLHDALPISAAHLDRAPGPRPGLDARVGRGRRVPPRREPRRSEEHTSELQSRGHLVCRLLLEKKKKNNTNLLLLCKNTTRVRTVLSSSLAMI